MSVSRETVTAETLADLIPESRESLDRLIAYAELLVKWQAKINLVGPATLPDLWQRHMLDSAQMAPHLPVGPFLDLGSGAGFPGLVLSIVTGQPVHLVESDARKCAFLREAARITAAPATIHNLRIESLKPFPVAAITARALATVEKLLDWAEPFLSPDVTCLFLKGQNSEEELTQARENWNMTVGRIPSLSDPSGIILHLKEVRRGRNEQ